MPHLIIEHSANVADIVDIDELVDAAARRCARHRARRRSMRCGPAPSRVTHYAIADRHPDNAFVAVTARLGAGPQPTTTSTDSLDALMAALDEHARRRAGAR